MKTPVTKERRQRIETDVKAASSDIHTAWRYLLISGQRKNRQTAYNSLVAARDLLNLAIQDLGEII